MKKNFELYANSVSFQKLKLREFDTIEEIENFIKKISNKAFCFPLMLQFIITDTKNFRFGFAKIDYTTRKNEVDNVTIFFPRLADQIEVDDYIFENFTKEKINVNENDSNELAEIKRDFDVQDILDDLQTHELIDIKNYAELMLAIKYNDSFVNPKEKEDVEMTLIYSIKDATKTADEKIMKCFDKLTECPDSNKKGV